METIFTNATITDVNDITIGAVYCDPEVGISWNEYIMGVRWRFQTLLQEVIDENLASGRTIEEAGEEVLNYLKEYLYNRWIDDMPSDCTIDGLVDAIIDCRQYQLWQSRIHRKFLDEHRFVNSDETLIKPESKWTEDGINLIQDAVYGVEQEDSIFTVVETLSQIY